MAESFLDHLQNLKILNQLSEIYYKSTGMVISFHYPGKNGRIRFYPQEEKSEYCQLIQSIPEGKSRCLKCDRDGLETARRKNSYHIYRCHAGLVDVAIPLIYKGTEIGSIYTGQVLLEPRNLNNLQSVYRSFPALNVSYERLAQVYTKIKIVSRDHLLFYAKLLHLIANYILLMENELYLERMVVLKNRELHKKEIEKINLEKTLKELSISVLESEKSRHPSAIRDKDKTRSSYIVSKAQLFIQTYYSTDIRLEDVARAVYLSPNYFSSLFKRVSGCTFRSYLVRKRMEAAKTLLTTSSLPIKEIVFRTGFKDYNYFNRTFTAMEGITPARFRSGQRYQSSIGRQTAVLV
ncbi:MAG: PocR ligand-binding domain-containing protein [Spirochaetaceae bacterium]|nr:MAG: PocR ligand-binding domain-containing protein [Spirochaetaceae bacterium]